MMQGLDCTDGDLALDVSRRAFEKGLIIETSGSDGQVIKCLAPLTTTERDLKEGLRILGECVRASLAGAEEAELAEVGR